jgi:hypothetical protein
MQWSESHHQRTGRLPKYNDNPIADTPW